MRRTTIILLAVLIVILGAGTYLWVTKTKIAVPWIKESNTAVTNTANKNSASNSNTTVTPTPPVNTSLPTEVKGDTAFSGTMSIGGVQLSLSSLQWTTSYNGLKPATGNKLLVIYIDPIPFMSVAAAMNGMSQVSLSTSGGVISLLQNKIAGDSIKNDRGYLLFDVPTNAKDLFLQNGPGPTAQRLSIPVAK